MARTGTADGPSAAVAELAAIGLLIVLGAVVLTPIAFLGELPRATDTTAFYGPVAAFLHARLAHGDLPLWSPDSFSGQPFAADAQSGVLYPPALLISTFAGPDVALRLLALFHYAVAGLSTYLLVRLCGGRRLAAVYAGLAYAVGGHLVARSAMLGLLGGAAWLPTCLATAELIVRAPPRWRPAATVALAFAFAFSLLSGSQQLTAVAGAACLVWLALRLGRRGIAWGAAGGAGGLLLAAVSVLPRLEMVRRSTSAGGYADPAGIGSLAFGDVRALAGQFGVSHSELTTLYVGAATPALALVALARKNPLGRPLAALALLAIVWATGLVGWLVSPVASLQSIAAHEPVRAMALAVLVLAVLGALALDRAHWPAPAAVVVGSLAVGLLAAGTVAFRPSYLLPLAATALVLTVLRHWQVAPALATVALILPLVADLAWHDYHQPDPHGWHAASDVFPSPSGSAAYLLARKRADGPFRFATVAPRAVLDHQLGAAGSERARALLLDMEGTRLGLEDVAGYNPLHLASYNGFLTASNGGAHVDRHFEFALRAPTSQLRALAVRYYVSPPGQIPPGLEVVYRSADAVVARDDQALPMARIVRPGQAPEAASIVSRTPDETVVRTPAGAAGRLVLADVAYPGWDVTVDGHAARSTISDGLLRSVELGPGSHRVVWRFEPGSLRLGLAVSLIALVAASGVALWPAMRRRARLG